MDNFKQQLKSCAFFQDLIAELRAESRQRHEGALQAVAIVATAAARQLDAGTIVQNLERMEALFSRQAPNAARSEILSFAIGLVRNSGTKATPPTMN